MSEEKKIRICQMPAELEEAHYSRLRGIRPKPDVEVSVRTALRDWAAYHIGGPSWADRFIALYEAAKAAIEAPPPMPLRKRGGPPVYVTPHEEGRDEEVLGISEDGRILLLMDHVGRVTSADNSLYAPSEAREAVEVFRAAHAAHMADFWGEGMAEAATSAFAAIPEIDPEAIRRALTEEQP